MWTNAHSLVELHLTAEGFVFISDWHRWKSERPQAVRVEYGMVCVCVCVCVCVHIYIGGVCERRECALHAQQLLCLSVCLSVCVCVCCVCVKAG